MSKWSKLSDFIKPAYLLDDGSESMGVFKAPRKSLGASWHQICAYSLKHLCVICQGWSPRSVCRNLVTTSGKVLLGSYTQVSFICSQTLSNGTFLPLVLFYRDMNHFQVEPEA